MPSSSSGKIPVPRPLPTATSGTWNTSGVFQGMPYAILMPYGYDATKYVYPLLVCLHSSGPMDNGVTNNSSTLISNVIQPEGFDIFNDNPNWTPYSTFWPGGARKNYPAIIVVPAVSGDSNYWGGYEANGPTASGQQVHDLVTSLMSSLSVDPARVYCMGFSYGGLGSYEQAYFWPDLYAGIVPMAGAPNSTLAIATWAAKLKTMPIWGIHCTADNTVSYSRDLLGYQALSQAAGLGLMQFTQVNQATWSPYGGDSHTSAEDEGMTKTVYWDWLFSQAKAGTTTSTPATVTTTSFSFTHPQVAAGNHTLSITDGTNSYKVTYTVTTNRVIQILRY